MNRKTAHISIVVHHVVGQLEFVEGRDLLRPLTTAARRVGVHVDTAGHVRVSLAGHDPTGCVERIAVSLVVARHEVHHHHVVGDQVEPEQTNLEGWEHPSEGRTTATWSETNNYCDINILTIYFTWKQRVVGARRNVLSMVTEQSCELL